MLLAISTIPLLALEAVKLIRQRGDAPTIRRNAE